MTCARFRTGVRAQPGNAAGPPTMFGRGHPFGIEDLPPGQHELRWTYEKDGSVDHGDDCARIDDVRFEVLD